MVKKNIKRSWEPAWDKIFRIKEWGKYPPLELVRFIARNYYNVLDRKKIKILDLGCGPGAASWYMAREGFSICGIDGSPTAIGLAKKRFKKEHLSGDFKIGDIVKIDYPDNNFDCVVDIACIQHNSPENIKLIISEAYRALKKGGRFFSMMRSKDIHVKDWPGQMHFFSQTEIKKILKRFRDLDIGYTIIKDKQKTYKFWVVSAKK